MRYGFHILLLLLASCGGMSAFGVSGEDQTSRDAAIRLPVLVNAGADREILRGYDTFLDGQGSTHPQGMGFSVTWTQVSGEPVYFNQYVMMPTFVAPLTEQPLVFELLADDGRFVTRDEVTLHVKKEPRRLAPRVRAGPDRFLDVTQKPEPTLADVHAISGNVNHWWKAIGFDTTEVVGAPPSIWRLTGERDGLHSAPDYLILHPYAPEHLGSQAPNAPNVTAQQVVIPMQEFTLDASKTDDPNGGPIRFRWVQTRGTPILPEGHNGDRLTLVAPPRKEEISFRVFARDDWLESVGTEVSIVVGADIVDPLPPLSPGPDRRTRSGREVVIDALNGVQWSGEDTEFSWTQTFGTPVMQHQADGSLFAFVTPDGVGDLAFAVYATNSVLQGQPTVVKVSVVGEQDNLPPTVFLTTALTESGAVRVMATACDPEGDTIVGCQWSAHKEPEGHAVEMPSCSVDADGVAILVEMPPTNTTVIITHTSWDEFGAYGEASLNLLAEQ